MRPAVAAVLLLSACGAPAPERRPPASVAPRQGLRYDVRVADDLARLDVRIALGEPRPRLLALGDEAGLPFLRGATWESGEASAPLARDGPRLVLDGAPAGADVTYTVDLVRLVDEGPGTRVGRDLCAAPGLWLLRPWPLAPGARATLAFSLPERAGAAVSWPCDAAGEHVLDETAFRRRGLAAFGPHRELRVETAGAVLDVALLDRPTAASPEAVAGWIARAADAVAGLHGTFPVPRVRVFVRPATSEEPVGFGETLRAGGAAVVLRLSADADASALARDGVALHEFVHLGMPAMRDEDAWLSEGLVQYAAEVLRGRSGARGAEETWGALLDGFDRGRRDGTGRALADESASMPRTHAWRRVYWAGAAVALLLDVELRRAGDGRSLDAALRETAAAFLGRADAVSADEVLARLDAWLGRPLFTETAGRHLASAEFPDVAPLLADLGVARRDGAVVLDDAAPLADVRRAILAPSGR